MSKFGKIVFFGSIAIVAAIMLLFSAYDILSERNIQKDIIITDFKDKDIINPEVSAISEDDPGFKEFLEFARQQDEKNRAYLAEIEEKKRAFNERLSALTKRDENGDIIPDDVFGIADEVIEISNDSILDTQGWQLFKDNDSNFSFLYPMDNSIKWYIQDDSTKWWLNDIFDRSPVFFLTTSESGLSDEPKPGISMTVLKGGASEDELIYNKNWARITVRVFSTDKSLIDWMKGWFYAERGCKGCPTFPKTMQYTTIGGLRFVTTPFFNDVIGDDLAGKTAYYQLTSGSIVAFYLTTQNGADNTKEVELLHNTFYTLLSKLSI
ncbi:hypothetical protein IIA94_03035 [Patescibacteria group bacterium]|nr:hypothetical protein [Patescibacteria group bacterium]